MPRKRKIAAPLIFEILDKAEDTPVPTIISALKKKGISCKASTVYSARSAWKKKRGKGIDQLEYEVEEDSLIPPELASMPAKAALIVVLKENERLRLRLNSLVPLLME